MSAPYKILAILFFFSSQTCFAEIKTAYDRCLSDEVNQCKKSCMIDPVLTYCGLVHDGSITGSGCTMQNLSRTEKIDKCIEDACSFAKANASSQCIKEEAESDRALDSRKNNQITFWLILFSIFGFFFYKKFYRKNTINKFSATIDPDEYKPFLNEGEKVSIPKNISHLSNALCKLSLVCDDESTYNETYDFYKKPYVIFVNNDAILGECIRLGKLSGIVHESDHGERILLNNKFLKDQGYGALGKVTAAFSSLSHVAINSDSHAEEIVYEVMIDEYYLNYKITEIWQNEEPMFPDALPIYLKNYWIKSLSGK